MTLLDEVLQAWADTRSGVMSELRNLPATALDFRPTPVSRSAAELVRHIIEVGLMMTGELTRPDGDFQRKSYPAFLKEYAPNLDRHRTKAQLLQALRRTHEDGEKRLRQAGERQMLQLIRQFNGVPGTRLAWLHHGISHEEYHRGQLALYARLLGRVPALTQLIEGS